MTMKTRLSTAGLKNNLEFQSSIVRLAVVGTASLHILFSHTFGRLPPGDFEYYLWTVGIFIIMFLGILVSVLIRPVWPARRFVTLAIDICAITAAFLPSEAAINPFCLLYLWVSVSYGARYGKKHLFYAATGSAVAYASVAFVKDLFLLEPTETGFFLIFLLVLPFYQYMIISARIAAEQATEVKNRFLSTMTHELRTPLSGVIGMSCLLDSSRLDSEQREYVKSIQSASDILMSLIGDILDFSKIEAKRLEVDNKPFDIYECVGVVIQSLSSRAEEKGIELICRIDEDVPSRLRSDAIRIKQILFNLIGNAIKFTERGEVEVRVSTTTGSSSHPWSLQFSIRDTGPGIPTDKLTRIFEGFWQENLSVTRKHGGTGLGTTISRELARMLGGDVDVTSTAGVGSTFRLTLPLDTRRETPAVVTPNVFAGRTFLVFETNENNFSAISDTLTAAGAEVFSRSNHQDSRRIDAAIFADGLDCFDFSTLVEAQSKNLGADVPILILGYATRRYSPEFSNWSFLPKPFIPQKLREAISNLLEMTTTRLTTNTEAPISTLKCTQQPANILVAEDEPINARLISALLTKSGHDATLINNGVKALKLLSEESFDLAILDVRMPEMGGIEVARRLRILEQETGRHMPIIALTASAMSNVKQECLSAGMDEFLLKPIDPDLLHGLIERFAKNRVMKRTHGNKKRGNGGGGLKVGAVACQT